MNCSKELLFSTFVDSWYTYHNHFNKNISLDHFLAASTKGKIIYYKIKDLINNPPLNLNKSRLEAKTIDEAYSDKPRGLNDIKSVKYHMKIPFSPPIIIIENKKTILLDGMHRLVAAKLNGKRTVPIYVINIE